MRILYDTELFGGASKEVPNVAHLQNKIVPMLLKENKQYVVIDIEHWDPINWRWTSSSRWSAR